MEGETLFCANEDELLQDRIKVFKLYDDWIHIAKHFEKREREEAEHVKRLEGFNGAIRILEDLKEERKERFLNDLLLISAAERNIQVCIEFLIDLSNLILSKKNLKIPQTYKEVAKELVSSMIELVGLRNIIVHLYADVKADIIIR